MQIMCIKNMPELGVYNGTRLIVTELVRRRDTQAPLLLSCCFYDEAKVRHEVDLPMVSISANDRLPFKWQRRQFPVRRPPPPAVRVGSTHLAAAVRARR